MICGFLPYIPIRSVRDFIERTGISLSMLTNYETGEAGGYTEFQNHKGYVTITFWGKHRTLKIIAKETERWSSDAISPVRSAFVSTRGSLHKYFRNGKNDDDFPIRDIWDAIASFCRDFGISVEKDVRITKIEVGVNIRTPFLPAAIINRLLMHKGRKFIPYLERNGPSLGVECNHTAYRIKIYDKGLQNDLTYNLLRVEVAFQRQLPFIKNLADLRNTANLEKLAAYLPRVWSDVILGAEQNQSDDLLAKSSFEYWQAMRSKVSRSTFSKRLKAFRANVAATDGDMHAQLLELINVKISELLIQ